MNFESKSVIQWKGCFHCWIPHRRRRDRKRRPAPSLLDINRGLSANHSVTSTPILPRQQIIAESQQLISQDYQRNETISSSLARNQTCGMTSNVEESREQPSGSAVIRTGTVEARYVQNPTHSYIQISECTSLLDPSSTPSSLSPLSGVQSSPVTGYFKDNVVMKMCKSLSSSRDDLDIPLLPPPLPPNESVEENSVKFRKVNDIGGFHSNADLNRDSLDLLIPAPRATICSTDIEQSYMNNYANDISEPTKVDNEEYEVNKTESKTLIASNSNSQVDQFNENYQEERLAGLIQSQSSLISNVSRSSSLYNANADYTPMGSCHSRFSKTSISQSSTQSIKISQFGKLSGEYGFSKSVDTANSALNDFDNYDLLVPVPRRTSCSSDCTSETNYSSSHIKSPCLNHCDSKRLINSDFTTNFPCSPTGRKTISGKLFLHASFSTPAELTGLDNSSETLSSLMAVPPPVPCRSARGRNMPFYLNDPANTRANVRHHNVCVTQTIQGATIEETLPNSTNHSMDHSEYILMDSKDPRSDQHETSLGQGSAVSDTHVNQGNVVPLATVPTAQQNGHLTNHKAVTCTPTKSLPYSDIALPTRRRIYSDEASTSADETEDETEEDDDNYSSSQESNFSHEANDISVSLKQVSVNQNKAVHMPLDKKLSCPPLSSTALSGSQPTSLTGPKPTDVQYLDLDLHDSEDTAVPEKSSPRSIQKQTRDTDNMDYKEIDFSKTEALKATKRQLESERSINS